MAGASLVLRLKTSQARGAAPPPPPPPPPQGGGGGEGREGETSLIAGRFISCRTSSIEFCSNPGRPMRCPSMRRIFQPGRDSPSGATAAANGWGRPSALTKVPSVSVNGASGSHTSAYSTARVRYGDGLNVVIITTNYAVRHA